MSVNVGSAVGYLDLDISGFLSELKTAQSEAGRATKSITTKFEKKLNNVGDRLKSAGSALTKSITVPLTVASTAAFNFSKDFETAFSKVKTIADPLKKNFGELKTEVVDLSNKTGMAASSLADAMYQAISSGVDTADAVGFVADATKLAVAGFTDSTTAVDTLTTIMNAYGMGAKDVTHISDVLISIQNKGKTTVDELGSTIGKIIPTANAMGVSLEDLGVAYSYATSKGIGTAETTTYLGSMLNELGRSGTKASDILKERTGKSFQELMESGANLRDVLGVLQDEASETGVGFNDLWSSAEAGRIAQTLLSAETEQYANTLDDFKTTVDDTSDAYETMANTSEYKLNQAMQTIKNTMITLGDTIRDMLLPYVEKAADLFIKLQEWLSNLSDEQKEQIVKWVMLAAALGPALLIFGKIASGVGNVIAVFGRIPGAFNTVIGGASKMVTSFRNIGEAMALSRAGFPAMAGQASKLGAAIAGVTAPIMIVVAAVGVLVAAFVTLWKTNDSFRKNLEETWKKIQATFEKFTSGLVDKLNELGFNFKDITDVLSAAWKGFCDLLAPIFEGAFEVVATVLETILSVITGVLDVFIGLFTGNWEQCWNGIKEIFLGIWNGIKDFFLNILSTLEGMANVFLGWFGTSWDECWNSIKTFFINIWVSISTFLSDTWETIKNVVQVGIMFISELFKAAFDLITLPFRFIWENCKETIMSVWESIKTTISNALTFIQTLITNVWNAVSGFFTTIWNGIKSFFSAVWDGLKNIVMNAINAIRDVISSVFNAVSNFISSIWNSIKNVTASVWDSIKSAISGPINTAKNIVFSVVDSIKSYFHSGFTSAKNIVSSIFDSIRNKISSVMDGAKNIVRNAVDRLKSFFNFSWSLPHIKLPHFNISGSFSLNPPSVPHFGISWYKKAMGRGMILNSPTIFGYDNKSGKFLGGGEAGSETVVGTHSLMSMIKAAVSETNGIMLNKLDVGFAALYAKLDEINSKLLVVLGDLVTSANRYSASVDGLGYVVYNGFAKKVASIERQETSKPSEYKGDTFNFYSPKPIDEVEAAERMKRAKRDLVEGF